MDLTQAPLLVIEDDAAIRALMCAALQDEGLACEAAADGREALAKLSEQRPAAVLLDLGLPHADGEAIAAYIQAHFGDSVPIIVVSATAQFEARPWRLGARAYVQKPFDLNVLLDTVHRVLGQEQDSATERRG
ncbi:MAG TPA: response regulator [Dehalococcoidia bacterium]|nr:response regulator [Dehalococcoidia bacterium]